MNKTIYLMVFWNGLPPRVFTREDEVIRLMEDVRGTDEVDEWGTLNIYRIDTSHSRPTIEACEREILNKVRKMTPEEFQQDLERIKRKEEERASKNRIN